MDKRINILSTALLPDTLRQLLFDAGFQYTQHAFIRTEAVQNAQLTKSIKALAEQNIAVIFTSARAVEAVAASLDGQAIHWRIFCLSGSTLSAVRAVWPDALLEQDAKDAAALASAIVAQGKDTPYTFFCGDQRLDILPQYLREHGLSLSEYIVYHTIPDAQTIAGDWDAVLFYSPSGLHSFLAANTMPAKAVAFAIGPTTGAAITARISNPVYVAPRADKKELIQSLLNYYIKTTR